MSSTSCSVVVARGEPAVEVVVEVRVVGERAAELDDQLVLLVEPQVGGVLAGVDQDPPEVRRADQAVVAVADRVREQLRPPLAEEAGDPVEQRIPGQQHRQRLGRPRRGPLHVRHPRAGRLVLRGDVACRWSRGRLVERLDPGHQRHDATDMTAPTGGCCLQRPPVCPPQFESASGSRAGSTASGA